jgi:MoaA/NifB/PqqE/SkfB family radical SAM enzyme
MCGYAGAESPRDMPPALLGRLVEELGAAGAARRTLFLTGGDPTLHPAFDEILEPIDAWTGTACLLTNGRPVARETAERFLNGRGPRRAIVSLHGSPAVHERLTGTPGSFAKAAAGFAVWREAAAAARRADVPAPAINLTLTAENVGDVPAIVDIAADWQASAVRIDPVYRPRIDEWRLRGRALQRALDERAAWAARAHELGVALNDLSFFLFLEPRRCAIPMHAAHVGAGGSIFGCIPSKGGFRDDDARALGSVAAASLRSAWHSPAFHTFRQGASTRSFPFCRGCPPQHGVRMLGGSPCRECDDVDELVVVRLPEEIEP